MTGPVSGPAMLFRCAFAYSLLEFQAGHVAKIDVEAEGNRMSITDDGRGHDIGRQVGGIPYVEMIYSQLGIREQNARMREIAIHALGVSLFSAFCLELVVEARKDNETVRARFADGRLTEMESLDAAASRTGNTIYFTLSPVKLREIASEDEIRDYLRWIKAENPTLGLSLNGNAIEA